MSPPKAAVSRVYESHICTGGIECLLNFRKIFSANTTRMSKYLQRFFSSEAMFAVFLPLPAVRSICRSISEPEDGGVFP